jgi:pimeloyl-ACP methyl ester carboxylesterase
MRGGRQGQFSPEEPFVTHGLALTILAAGLAVLLFLSALTGALGWVENRRSGDSQRQRALLGGNVAPALARTFLNSVWSLWLTALSLPLGWLPLGPFAQRRRPGPGKPSAGGPPPVILVHGLYHNSAAWFVLRRRLLRAGFTDVSCYGYASFGRGFADIAAGLAEMLLEAARNAPGGRVALVGHSLGGLVIRAACVDAQVASGGKCRVAGVVTLGTPHRGSTLARMLGVGRLARGLAPGGHVIAQVRGLPPCPCPGLSLFTPTDGMVLPLSGAFLDERERANGWTELALPAMSHVGLLYSGAAAREAIAFLKRACAEGR